MSAQVDVEREIVSERTFPVSRERLFEAWSDPGQLKRWWGPKDFTNTFNQFDFRPGGVWDFIMHGPNGGNYPNRSVFVEIVPPDRIVFNHESAPEFQVVATFESVPEGTHLLYRMIFDSAELCAKIKTFAPEKNEENFDRLQAVLSES